MTSRPPRIAGPIHAADTSIHGRNRRRTRTPYPHRQRGAMGGDATCPAKAPKVRRRTVRVTPRAACGFAVAPDTLNPDAEAFEHATDTSPPVDRRAAWPRHGPDGDRSRARVLGSAGRRTNRRHLLHAVDHAFLRAGLRVFRRHERVSVWPQVGRYRRARTRARHARSRAGG